MSTTTVLKKFGRVEIGPHGTVTLLDKGLINLSYDAKTGTMTAFDPNLGQLDITPIPGEEYGFTYKFYGNDGTVEKGQVTADPDKGVTVSGVDKDGKPFSITKPIIVDLQKIFGKISPDLVSPYEQAVRTGSPLVLDLDGNGVQLSLLRDGQKPTLFDLDADGVRSGTAWVGAGDGLLALDLNHNGRIDTGRELFGNQTSLAGGALAKNGYEALKALDTDKNGRLDSADAPFADLSVWQDTNQDGLTGPGELRSLRELGISQIDLTPTAGNTTLADGSRLEGQAGFVMNGEQHAYTDAWFAQAPFYRDFGAAGAVASASSSGPDIGGSGLVQDLRVAMGQSGVLASLVGRFAQAGTPAERQALVEPILTAWADTSTMLTTADWATQGHAVSYAFQGQDAAGSAQWAQRLTVLEAFSGETYRNLAATGTTAISASKARLGLLQQSYDALSQDVYRALVLQTKLKPYLDGVSIVINGDQLTASGQGLLQQLDATWQRSPTQAVADLVELQRQAAHTLASAQVDSVPRLTSWVAAEAARDPSLASLRASGVLGTDQLAGTAGDDVFVNLASLSSFKAGAGQDILIGNDRADRLYGDDGNDQLFGAAGDDTLMGGNGQDSLLGGAGKDSLSGALGDDLLQGGLGNDTLTGGTGNDRYAFASGDGQDRIVENDSQGDSLDVLAFTGDIASSQLWFRQVANDLEISVIGSQDKVTVRTWFSDPGARLERIDTAGDGLSLTGAGVDALVAAMATLQSPASGLPISDLTSPSLSAVMAANWLSAG
jgi:hypothetical protein